MSYYDFDECHCDCHNPDMQVYHCMPCCNQCRHCGKNIKTYAIAEHEKKCAEEREALGLPLDEHNILSVAEEIDLEVLRDLKKAAGGLSMSERVSRDIERQAVEEMTKEESPAVKLLRECQERERKLGK